LFSNSLRELEEKAKNFLKNSTRKVLDIQNRTNGAVSTDPKNISHTKSMSLDIHLDARASSKKFEKDTEIRAKNKKPLKVMKIPPTPKNLNSLKE
jgi:hypothetical protein